VDEMFSPLEISTTLHLCMVEGGLLKGMGGKILNDVWDNLFWGFW